MNDQELYEFHQNKFTSLPANLRERMIARVKEVLHEEDLPKIRQAIASNPLSWWAPYHFFFGMAIRNALREAKLGEHEFPFLQNLDDHWVSIVEAAVKE